MKLIRNFLLMLLIVPFFTSCSVFKPKQGCGTNGKNVGAEQLLSGDKAPKVKKFKA